MLDPLRTVNTTLFDRYLSRTDVYAVIKYAYSCPQSLHIYTRAVSLAGNKMYFPKVVTFSAVTNAWGPVHLENSQLPSSVARLTSGPGKRKQSRTTRFNDLHISLSLAWSCKTCTLILNCVKLTFHFTSATVGIRLYARSHSVTPYSLQINVITQRNHVCKGTTRRRSWKEETATEIHYLFDRTTTETAPGDISF